MTDTMKANFSSLALSIASSAAMALGLSPDHETNQIHVDKTMAQFNIDMLLMLREKTKNNLSQEELELVNHLISDLQNHFISVFKK